MVEALADLIALGAGLVASDARDSLAPLWRGTTAAIAARRGPREERTTALFVAARHALRDPWRRVAAWRPSPRSCPRPPELEEALAR